ncbi:neuraminidase-like domain-containing protein [Paracoccus sp. (in: a-proteobacteria)]|uniref:neuraminidase-like domain-containing protein n=1 Tax=Paracoccus sp. TaxID=267 RepID=UPI0035B197D2
MNRVIHPLKPGSDGAGIADLQAALAALLARGAILPDAPDDSRALREAIAHEAGRYGDATAKAVSIAQHEAGLRATGAVDAETAARLNALLEQFGLADPGPAASQRVIAGQVLGDPRPRGLTVLAFLETAAGPLRLGTDQVDATGAYAITYMPPPVTGKTLLLVLATATGERLSELRHPARGEGVQRIDLALPAISGRGVVTGRLGNPGRPTAEGIALRLFDVNPGDDLVELARAGTGTEGRYRIDYALAPLAQRGKALPDLLLCAYDGERRIAESPILFDAGDAVVIDLLLPDIGATGSETGTEAGTAEFALLEAALKRQRVGQLRDMGARDPARELAYLAGKTGWDARAVALAALADRFSGDRGENGQGLSPVLYYALFRAGLPADPAALYATAPATIDAAWRAAEAAGVIAPQDAAARKRNLAAFRDIAAPRALDLRAAEGVASLREVIARTLTTPEEQQSFARLREGHRNDSAGLWAAAEAEFGPERAAALRLDGQLTGFTLRDAGLIARLHETAAISDPSDLARLGYFEPNAWHKLLKTVPAGVDGATLAERRENAAQLLAAQVRLAYPTLSLARQVETGAIGVDAAPEVGAFLSRHHAEFVLGSQPVAQFAQRAGIALDPETGAQIERIQRVHQITRDDAAMGRMLARGFDSAASVARLTPAQFVTEMAAELGGDAAALATHAKASQIHATVLSLATAWIGAAQAPVIGGTRTFLSAGLSGMGAAAGPAGDVVAMPVLEGLLGAMDYCGCDHCRSVLGPAAYLVDLLDFLDSPAPADGPNPLAVLLERRPDLAEIGLTCENTNTVLPHIDLVNEILGHFVAHNLSMAGFAGHDVQPDDRSEDLLAAPRHVDAAARARLAEAVYPPPLPWSAPLEALRAHFRAFDTELWRLIEALRPDDTPASWRAVLHERAGFSPAEIGLLTDGAIPLADLAGLDGATEDAAREQLSGAKAFARRAGISYEQLAELLTTRFVNPEAGLMARLSRLCLPFATLRAVKAGTVTAAELRDLLPAGLDPAAYGGDIHAWISDDAIQARIMSLIVLADEGDGQDPCSFDDVHLRRADPDPQQNRLRALDYRRMLHFLRLWRRLGWDMARLDAAIAALMPAVARNDADPAAEAAALDAAMAVLLDRLGVVLLVMDRLNIRPGHDLDMLLGCWADLGTAGADAPYARLFLNPAVLALTPAFADDGFGALPGQPATPLLDAAEALRAAFGLSGDEFALLAGHLGYGATTPLTLGNISRLARHIWLSRQLRISLREFLELMAMTGIDPFAPPDPGATAPPACLRFIDLIARARAAGIKPADLLRIFAGLDLSGRADPSEDGLTTLAHDLRAAMAAGDAALPAAALPDAAEPGPETLRAGMALAYGADAAEPFLGLLQGTLLATVSYDHDSPELAPAIVAAGGGRLIYDDLEKTLGYGGLMSQARADQLKALAGAPAAFGPAIDALRARGIAMAAPLFAAYPELAALHDGFIASTAPDAERYRALIDAMLASLIARQRARLAVQTAAAALSLPADLAATLLQAADVLHAEGVPDAAAVADLTGIAAGGLRLALHAGGDPGAAPDLIEARSGMGGGDLPLPGTGMAAIWSGWIDAPASGTYALSVQAGAGGTVTLVIDGADIPMTPEAGGRFVNAVPVTLSSARPVPITLTVTGLARRAVLRWSAQGMGWQVVPDRHLYPAGAMAALAATARRVTVLGALAATLKLGAGEMAWLARLPELRIAGAGWFNALPDAARAHAAPSPDLAACLDTVAGYVLLRRAIAADDAGLCRVLMAPMATLPDGQPALETLTGWSAASVDVALGRLGLGRADLARPRDFARLARVMAPVTDLRIPAPALFAAATTSPGPAEVAALQSALRARHSAAEWRELLKPVNDGLRRQERDALVAHILHRFQASPATRHIDTPNRLFEFFLIDVAMQPCFETSRIRAALSSVQLFVDRALMNLEPRVPPPMIRPERWEWMRRYRIWEANRKVFLWPENWLEPELRDDQSPAFREVMGSLLQSDITEDAAAQALGTYLMQLDEVAKLEPCGMFIAEGQPGLADDVVHVVARSPGAGRRYFHRSRQGGTWAPWYPVKLDIQDGPVIPCVWRDRLFLFWLTIRIDPLIDPAAMDAGSTMTSKIGETDMGNLRGDMKAFAGKATQVRVSAILNWAEKRGDDWLPPRTSDPERPTVLGTFAASGASAFDRASLRLRPYLASDHLNINIFGAGAGGFTLYTTHGAPLRREDMQFAEAMETYLILTTRSLTTTADTLSATYSSTLTSNTETRRIIALAPRTRLFEAVNHVSERWRAPFIIEDSRHVFYVRSEARPVTMSETVWVEAPPDKLVVIAHDFGIIHQYHEMPETVPPDPIGPIATPGAGASRYEIGRFVTTGARIRTALSDDRILNFDGVEIGLEGPVSIRQR